MGRIKNISGQRFGRLIARKFIGLKGRKAMWLCECDCGKEVAVSGGSLRKGCTKSCGCYLPQWNIKRNFKHGACHDRVCKIYYEIRKRCYNPNFEYYKDYGGRGITVCEEWMNNPQQFIEWAYANGYTDHLSIDRIDNDGDYSPQNCRWANINTQANNRRNNRPITINGKTKNLMEWAKEYGLDHKAISYRIDAGYTGVDLIKPPGTFRKKKAFREVEQ